MGISNLLDGVRLRALEYGMRSLCKTGPNRHYILCVEFCRTVFLKHVSWVKTAKKKRNENKDCNLSGVCSSNSPSIDVRMQVNNCEQLSFPPRHATGYTAPSLPNVIEAAKPINTANHPVPVYQPGPVAEPGSARLL